MGTTLGSLRHTRAQQQEVKWKGGSLPQGETLRPATQSGASTKPRLRETLGKPWLWPNGSSIPGGGGSTSGARYVPGQAHRVAGGSPGGPMRRDGQPQRAGPCAAVAWPTSPGYQLGP